MSPPTPAGHPAARQPEPPAAATTPPPAAAPADVPDLLHRTALGDEQAFSALYDATASMLFALVRRVVRDPSLSEEVLQEVYVEIWRHATRFDPSRGSARAWLCTIAHGRAVDAVRSQTATRRRDEADGRRQLATPPEDPQEEGILRVEAHRVERALRELTDQQQQAIRLAYFAGCSHREVAALLDVPLGTAKTRIRDGMIVLRDKLGVTS